MVVSICFNTETSETVSIGIWVYPHDLGGLHDTSWHLVPEELASGALAEIRWTLYQLGFKGPFLTGVIPVIPYWCQLVIFTFYVFIFKISKSSRIISWYFGWGISKTCDFLVDLTLGIAQYPYFRERQPLYGEGKESSQEQFWLSFVGGFGFLPKPHINWSFLSILAESTMDISVLIVSRMTYIDPLSLTYMPRRIWPLAVAMTSRLIWWQ